MGHVQDRWFKDEPDPNRPGKTKRVPTSRYGVGKRYRARVAGPEGEVSESFADGEIKAAREWVRKTETSISLGTWTDPKAKPPEGDGVTIEVFGSKWLADLDVDEASREIMEMRFRKNIYPHLGGQAVTAVKASDVRSWDSKLRKQGLSDQYRHTLFKNLAALFNAAVDDDLISKNPCSGKSVKMPKAPKHKVVPWEEGQVWAVRRGLPKRFQVVTDVGAGLGLRQGECFALAVEDIDREARRVTVCRQLKTVRNRLVFDLPKYDKVRQVPLPEPVNRSIEEHMREFPPVEITLPWAVPDGKLVTVRVILTSVRELPIRSNDFDREYWKKALKAADMPHGRYENGMHDLRHFFASVLLDQGESIKAVAEWLGHADASFTLRTYTHLMPSSDERTRGVIDGVYSRRDGPDGPSTAHSDHQDH
ncbi:tyrosine-type recombinase/integrase [Saccharothrix texasensis]|uniref:Site-specific recombinase XerD n=1 Tax=Saccharothrix texasensis TaxID=103734 RepID=A0A3N1HCN4_9PSEU|nr:tyrosine-type recombinase/integrase [Saccharothrix texasensis]ROP40216.1 site-specific recombinase XerD [Saccharothrix texasensis]